ncbi:hypothetical protein A7X74_10940 [Stenotrophomonas maltophilia]|uniref:hypothetical protein n=1 Tax=Stenotrophomonas maltophilia TaxID=40324 RepID=UPI000DA71BAF|nr:hypothetical protein [Stenotrophomonas maltophilia]PZS80537.1 hypothetical protein A7X74_10940 [Stenotrophomonas maltophilia]
MPYRDLYAYAQELEPVVSRNAIRDKIIELTEASGFRFFRDHDLNPEELCGYYLSPGNAEHQFARQAGGKHVVAFAAGLNRCWERFVVLKEMMHLFDSPLEMTNTADDLDSIFVGMLDPDFDGKVSPQCMSEFRCFWMALGVVCPERIRAQLQQRRDAGTMTELEIATYLRIPEAYVGRLCHPNFKHMMARLSE